ncbi:Phage head-tail adaptor protein [Candidatus Trichorickettsia mobilis]|uniref:Phage head-tail adaptor protein n=1 Tax=Candidatus Trichorickettsia mobilis TaxID=1346319 RepID=A0ABZ0UT05_9RICK|nr:head-tail adaptor protein [Candidatus Trichorickettsia mobilis]WPY00222.1 Phage head-tail adaptor protein [Candidatus Trichorickettsia mobilis]
MTQYLSSKNLKHQVKFLENVALHEIEFEDWQEKLVAYADIQPACDNRLNILEQFSFDHVMTEALFLFRLRFIAGITIKLRINFNSRLFEIKRIINLNERNRWLQIIALEIL